MNNHIPVVDLFAGPGGLGEGFSSLDDTFRILVSAEMDTSAHKTLLLRAFFRKLKQEFPEGLDDYYRYCNDEASNPWSDRTKHFWEEAEKEACRLELGKEKDNARLDSVLEKKLDPSKPWVLIGGPPCQAYSLVGRARNKGIKSYVPEEDHRHFLYQQYLRIIQKYKPSVFVMENVKGILSSKINGKFVFHGILQDLSDPNAAVGGEGNSHKYRICSLVSDVIYSNGDDPQEFDAHKFIIRSENYGIPQARHRVILVGIREDLFQNHKIGKLKEKLAKSLGSAIGRLPKLRSQLSKQVDSQELWANVVIQHAQEIIQELSESEKHPAIIEELRNNLCHFSPPTSNGMTRFTRSELGETGDQELDRWYLDPRLKKWLNHEARGHMSGDLRRYLFAASFAKVYDRSPKGSEEFCLESLRPQHKNWDSGNFSDRFRVQVPDRASSTITSHISKDGHYFIHPDPKQCRSLTVREAARLQTFPDNYFFQGYRTQQFHQVGNAVPPLLSRQIALIVKSFLK